MSDRARVARLPHDVQRIIWKLIHKDVIRDLTKHEFHCIFFWTDWCPHCLKMMPEWLEFARQYNGRIIGNSAITTEMIDCSHGRAGYDNHLMCYPTIRFVVNGHVLRDYPNATRTCAAFVNYIRSLE